MKKPSITELLSLLDKPALLNWANKQGLNGIDISKKRNEWLSKGSSIHKQIELYHTDGINFINNEDEVRYLSLMQDKKVVCVEKMIDTDWFCGRLDCVLDFNGKRYLVDYKSTKKGSVYFENKLQMVAYGMAERCDAFAIIAIPSFKFIEVEIKDRKPYEEIIKSLSNIYYQKQLI